MASSEECVCGRFVFSFCEVQKTFLIWYLKDLLFNYVSLLQNFDGTYSSRNSSLNDSIQKNFSLYDFCAH